MWQAIKTVLKNLWNAKFLVKTLENNTQLRATIDHLTTKLNKTADNLKVCTKASRTFEATTKALVKRYGPSVALPTRCLDEAKNLKVEMTERDQNTIWIRVKGPNSKTH